MQNYCHILFICIYILPFPLFGEPAQSGGVPSIIIYNFHPVQENFPAKYNYLTDTIPDIIREQLLADNFFYLVEKGKVRESALVSGNTENEWYRYGRSRLAVAKSLESDYFIWGYFVIEEERLLIFFQLVETASARTVHIDKGEFPIGFELFDKVDLAAKNFSGWINKALPEKFQLTLEEQAATPPPAVKQVVEQTSPTIPPEELKPNPDFSLDICGQYHFFLPPFARYLKPSPGLRLNITFHNKEPATFYYGLSLLVTLLNQPALGDTPAGDNITLLFLPFMLKTGMAINFLNNFSLDLSADLGMSLFFGYLAPEVVAYFRFTAGPEILLAWHPSPFFKIGLGLGCLLTPYSYSDWLMLNLAPEIQMAFTL